jgi:hypothetical protein
MARHYTDWGVFGHILEQYADLRGYVPERGDKPEQFEWPAGADPTEYESWELYVESCEEAISMASKWLERWRRENG